MRSNWFMIGIEMRKDVEKKRNEWNVVGFIVLRK